MNIHNQVTDYRRLVSETRLSVIRSAGSQCILSLADKVSVPFEDFHRFSSVSQAVVAAIYDERKA